MFKLLVVVGNFDSTGPACKVLMICLPIPLTLMTLGTTDCQRIQLILSKNHTLSLRFLS